MTQPPEIPQPTEDELIEAALAAFDQEPLPTVTAPDPAMQGQSLGGVESSDLASHATSRTLEALDESRRPKAKTVCEDCPNSVWFASPAEVKCYCRVMFLVTWSSKEPNQITHCDGTDLGGD